MEPIVPFDCPASEALTAAEQAIIATYAPANSDYGPARAVEAARRLHREAAAEIEARADSERRARRNRNWRKRDREAAAAHVAARLWQSLVLLEPDTARLTKDGFVGFAEFSAWIEGHGLRLDPIG